MILRTRLLAAITMTMTIGLCLSTQAQEDPLTPAQRQRVDRAIGEAHAQQRRTEVQKYLSRLATSSNGVDQQVDLISLLSLRLPAEEGVPTYLSLLGNKSDVVQQGALAALREYGPPAKEAIPKILEVFQNPGTPYPVAATAAQALGAISPQTPAVISSLTQRLENTSNPDLLTLNAVEALGLAGPAAREAEPTLMQYLSAPSSAVQCSAYRAVGRIKGAVRPSVPQQNQIEMLTKMPPGDGAAILLALQKAGPAAESTVPPLLKLLNQESPLYIRCLVIETLGRVGPGHTGAIQVLLMAVASNDEFISRLAAESLAQIDPKEVQAVTVLTDALHHPQLKVRHQAALALQKFGPMARLATQALAEALNQADGATDHHQIGAYLDALRSIGPSAVGAADTLVKLLPAHSRIYENRDHFTANYLKGYLFVTLADIGTPRTALPFILESLKSGGDGHHTAPLFAGAARAAAALGPEAHAAVPFLLHALQPDFHDGSILFRSFFAQFDATGQYTSTRIEAIRALARIGPAARNAIPLLTQLSQEAIDSSSDLPPFDEEARKALQAIRGG